MQKEFKMHLYLVMHSWQEKPVYMVSENHQLEEYNCSDTSTYQYIRPLDIKVDRLKDPTEIDHNEFRLWGIRRAQQTLMAEYQKKMTELKDTEQSLLAIAMEVKHDDLPI